jgi:DNA-binding transcriptional ArsR family regulator
LNPGVFYAESENLEYEICNLESTIMTSDANSRVADTKTVILTVLQQRAKKALFVTELAAALRRFNVDKAAMEQGLSELQGLGLVVLRDNFCADPHLENVDLRVAAPLDETAGAGADAHAAALREIDMAWNKWLGEYLANHRCG